MTDHIEPAKIVHLAKILVHINSVKSAAEPRQHQPIEQAIRNHCERRRVSADIIWPETAPYPRLKYRIRNLRRLSRYLFQRGIGQTFLRPACDQF